MRFQLTGTIGPVTADGEAAWSFVFPGTSYGAASGNPWTAQVAVRRTATETYTACRIYSHDYTVNEEHLQWDAASAAACAITVETDGVDCAITASTPYGNVSHEVSGQYPNLVHFPELRLGASSSGAGSAICGPPTIDLCGHVRNYDWSDFGDWTQDYSALVADGSIVASGGADIDGQFMYWRPILHGPAVLQALAGYPVWRWQWQRMASLGDGYPRYVQAVCSRNGGDGVWEEQAAPWTIQPAQALATGLAAWMTDDGHVHTVTNRWSPSGTTGWYLQIDSPTTGYAAGTSPIGTTSMGYAGWDPVATRLWPSNDVLIVWIGDSYGLMAARVPYWVSSISRIGSYDVDNMVANSVGATALATGGIWNDDTGRLYLSYLDLDGVTQLIISDDGGETWAASE